MTILHRNARMVLLCKDRFPETGAEGGISVDAKHFTLEQIHRIVRGAADISSACRPERTSGSVRCSTETESFCHFRYPCACGSCVIRRFADRAGKFSGRCPVYGRPSFRKIRALPHAALSADRCCRSVDIRLLCVSDFLFCEGRNRIQQKVYSEVYSRSGRA